MKPLRGRLVLDASVLIEILAGSKPATALVDSIVSGEAEVYATRLGLTEALYVTCRLWGWEKALERIQALIDSGMVAIIEDEEIWSLAASCKCRIPISLGDCYTLAAAKRYRLRPLFLKPEKELLENTERIRQWLDGNPEYLATAAPT